MDCKLMVLDVQGLVRKRYRKVVTTEFWEDREAYLKHLDIVKVGPDELGAVSVENNPKSVCKELSNLGPNVVALTFGEEGSLVYDRKNDLFYKLPAFKTRVVDPTGAGDVYGMSLAIRYYETGDALEAAIFATAAASLSVETFGPNSIAGRKTVEKRAKVLEKTPFKP